MAKTASTLLTNVLARIRDPLATGIATNTPPTTTSGNTFGYAVLTQAQLFVNCATQTVTSSATLTLTPATALYSIFANFASCVKVLSCQVWGGRDLYKTDWHAHGRANRRWLTAIGSTPSCWSMIGMDLLAIVPAVDKVTNAGMGVLTVRYVPVTSTVVNGASTFDMPDDELGLVETLATALCSLKTKQLADFQNAMTRLQQNIETDNSWDVAYEGKAV